MLNHCFNRLCDGKPTGTAVYCERCEQDKESLWSQECSSNIPALRAQAAREISRTAAEKRNDMSNSAPLQITNLTANLSDTIGVLPIVCTLTFTDPNSPSAGVTIERTRASDPSCDSWIQLTQLPAGVHTYTDSTLTFGGVWRYRVQALPFQSVIFSPAKYAEISVKTQGEQPHRVDGYPAGLSPNDNGLTYQGNIRLITNGTHLG